MRARAALGDLIWALEDVKDLKLGYKSNFPSSNVTSSHETSAIFKTFTLLLVSSRHFVSSRELSVRKAGDKAVKSSASGVAWRQVAAAV